MPDWPSAFAGSRVEQLGDDLTLTAGINVDSSASANTKGSYVELSASTPFDADGFYLTAADGVTGRDYLIDIAVGAAGSEAVILENIPFHTGGTGNIGLAQAYIPIPIKAGTRVSARAQASTGSSGVRLMVRLVAGSFYASIRCGRATTYGAATADSGGVSVDPGGVANTKGSYAQIVASLTNPFACCMVCLSGQANAARQTARWFTDVAIGGAGSEQVLIDNHYSRVTVAVDNDTIEPIWSPLMFVSAKSGERLAARAQSHITDATDRLFDVVVIGFD